MTARQIYEAVLIEMNKTNAPSLLLEDFNVLFNKAINLYVNKKYNIYDISLQTTDDLRVLKSTAILPVSLSEHVSNVTERNSLYGATYEAYLPLDYLHLLNCVCNFYVTKTNKCYDENTFVQFGAYRMTPDIWSQCINNFYMRPSYKRPYYYIHNVNSNESGSIPTNPYLEKSSTSLIVPGYETSFGLGTDATVTTIGEKLQEYLENLEELGFEIDKEYTWKVDAERNQVIADDTLLLYVATKDELKKIIVYDPTNKSFSLRDYNGAQVSVIDGTLFISTSSTNLYVKNETLYINNKLIDFIVTDQFLEKYADVKITLGLPRTLKLNDGKVLDLVEKEGMHRYGNASNIRIEIRCGKDSTIFLLKEIYVDYIKTPQHIRLTLELLDMIEDTSLIMEFPDYVCQEIINELTHIMMENASDPRLQSHPVVSQSIANPAQALAAATKA